MYSYISCYGPRGGSKDQDKAQMSNSITRSKLKRHSTEPKYFDDYNCNIKDKMK